MMTGIAFWILSSDRSSTATAAARSSPYLINEATDSLPINIRKMALGLWRLTSKQRPCTYKSGDLTVQGQLVRDKIPMTLGFFDENCRYHRDRDTFCNQFEYPVDYRNFFINIEWLFTTIRALVNMLNMATLKKHSVGMIHNDQKNSLCK